MKFFDSLYDYKDYWTVVASCSLVVAEPVRQQLLVLQIGHRTAEAAGLDIGILVVEHQNSWVEVDIGVVIRRAASLPMAV